MSLTIKDASGEVIKTLDTNINKTILQQLSDAEIELPAACFTGICGACMCEIETGGEYIDKAAKTEPGFPLADEEVMTCIAKIKEGNGKIVLKKMY